MTTCKKKYRIDLFFISSFASLFTRYEENDIDSFKNSFLLFSEWNNEIIRGI